MKGLKKVIAVGFVAAAVLGIAASASAKAPKTPELVTVMLYKEKKSCPDNRYVADTATTFIPIKNLRWNAAIKEISVNNKKTCIDARAVGAFELNICKGTYAKPGDKSTVKFYIKQKEGDDYEYYKRKVTVRYIAAINPVLSFTFRGKDEIYDATTHNMLYTKEFVNDYANKGKTVKTVDYTLPAGVTEVAVNFKLNTKYYTEDKMYGTLKSGKEIRIYNGNMYDISKFCKLTIKYKTTIAKWKVYSAEYNKTWKFYKEPNDSYKGTKRFDNVKSLVLNLK
jgi:hypothetical protein